MKLLYLQVFFLFAFTLTSCKKQGCTDKTAINYTIDANSDDGSCYHPKFLRIKNITLKVISNTNENGDEWDENGLPDCSIGIVGLYESEVIDDVELLENVVFKVEPNILIPLDQSNNQFIDFYVLENDTNSSTIMANPHIYLNEFPYSGYSNIHPYVYYNKLITLENNDLFKSVLITAEVEWE